ncbi:unnamed protein product [Cyclocybe aegerita]|uniref:Uncharacterized protein n=1 Tax=Cyclocybe aegerita TaxID=1973307 RepID=A0A8S0VQ51_CYCAE|nr:unnamed protein product [Cyclocybe aegerita]
MFPKARPIITISQPTQEADHEDLSCSSETRRVLETLQPNPIPLHQTLEPEVMSDHTGSSYVPRVSGAASHQEERSNAACHPFDHCKDNSIYFAVLLRTHLGDIKHILACLIEGIEEHVWIIIATINISAVLEYRHPSRILRKACTIFSEDINGPEVAAAIHVMVKKAAALNADLPPAFIQHNQLTYERLYLPWWGADFLA